MRWRHKEIEQIYINRLPAGGPNKLWAVYLRTRDTAITLLNTN
jgi:hypothetical protein